MKSATGTANWKNRTLFHGDNLPFLRGMNSESVDLIATDPPFNKGRDFHATPDSLTAGAKFQDRWSWERDVHEEWTDQITDDHPRLMEAIESARYAHSDGMGAFMCFMAVRLLAMHRVLKSTGSIYLHCDPTASHYLKAVMDAIFGWQGFQNEIIWHYRKWTNAASYFQRNHDVVLLYSKNAGSHTFNKIMVEPTASQAAVVARGYNVNRVRSSEGGSKYQLLVYDKKKVDALVKSGKLDISKYDAVVDRDGQNKTGANDVWEMQILHAHAKERIGYPTQKPLALYERMIQASSNENDIVLDPFAGCATTLVAAEKLQRQWVGMDIWERAHEVVVERLRNTTGLLGEVTYTTDPPKRTDDGETAAPFLRVKQRVKEPDGPRWTRTQMYEHLLEQNGPQCQGCDRTFDDPRYLELDHNTPRSDGGLNHISNRILLCGPCNRLKSNTYTLSGLRRENAKRGHMRRT